MSRKAFHRVLTAALALLTAAAMTACAQPSASSTGGAESGTPSAASGAGQKEHKLKILGKDRRDNLILVKDREQYQVWQEFSKFIKDSANITLDFELVPKEQYATTIQSRMAAANDLPDIVNLVDVSDSDVIGYGKVGTVIDLKAAIDQYSNGNTRKMWAKHWPEAEKRLTTADGKIYWYPGLSYSYLDGEPRKWTGFSVLYRYDWLEKLKLQEPKSMDDLFSLLKAFQDQDANGNGQKDEIVSIDIDNFYNGISWAFGLAPELVSINQKEDKAVSPWYQPGVKDYIAFMKKLVDAGLVDQSLIGASSELKGQRISENKVSLMQGYVTDYWDGQTVTAEKAHYVGTFPTTKYDSAYLIEPSDLVYMKFSVTKNCQDVEGAVALFDCIYTDKYAEMSMYGVEGNTFEVKDGRKMLLIPVDEKDQFEQKLIQGHSLFGHAVLPVVNIQENWRDENRTFGITDKMQEADDFLQDQDNVYSTSPQTALATDEELETINKYSTALETYSKELLTNLILGRESMDDWDSYLGKLKELGLDELLKVAQARHDRFLKS